MNKIFLATSGAIEPEDELIDKLKELSERYDGKVAGVIKYNDEMILKNPETLVEILKETDATHVFFIDSHFAVSEIINDCMMSHEADRLGIKLVDVLEGKEVQELANAIPRSLKDEVKVIYEKIKQLDTHEMSHRLQDEPSNQEEPFYQKNQNIVILSNHAVHEEEVRDYARQYILEHYKKDELKRVCGIHFEEFDKEVENRLNELIEEMGNLKFLIYNDIDS